MLDLLTFLFKGEMGGDRRVLRGKVGRAQKEALNGAEIIRFKLVYFFSWVLSIVLLVSLVGAIILKFKGIEDTLLPPIITGVIGYFGGAIASYFGIRNARATVAQS